MAEDLGQADQIVLVVGQELLCHRVAEQVRVQLHADDRRILVAKGSEATVSQQSSLPDEQPVRLHKWRDLQVP